MTRKVPANITFKRDLSDPLSHEQLDANFDAVKQSLEDLNTLINGVATTSTAPTGQLNAVAFSGDYNALSNLPDIASLDARITAIENPGALTASITAESTVAGGSTGTADDVVIVTSNGTPNISKIRLKVYYRLDTNTTSLVLDELRTVDLQGKVQYDLGIPVFRDYAGSKINQVTIEVYEDPSNPNANTNVLATKIIAIVDATASLSPSVSVAQADEGTTYTVTINTTNLDNTRVFNYTLTSNNADLIADLGGSIPATGTLTLTNVNSGTGIGSVNLDLPLAADSLTEGDETITVTVTDQIDNTITATMNVIINDSSRATESWTIQTWLTEVYGPNGANVSSYDVAAHITAIETARSSIVGQAVPSGTTYANGSAVTGENMYQQLIRSVFADPSYTIEVAGDVTYINAINGHISAYNTSATSLGLTDAYDYLVKRPSTGTNFDDIGYVHLNANPSVVIQAGTVIYSAVEENPNDL